MLKINFVKSLDQFELDISFECNGVLALVGPSGCGKSLTLRCIAGLTKPDQGTIEIAKQVYFDSAQGINLPPQQRNIGFLFQNYALFPHLTVQQNIAYGISNWPKENQNQKIRELVQLVRLEGLEGRYPSQLSGGQQQRVALARALAREPKLLLLDEPFSALDGSTRGKLQRELRTLLNELKIPTVLVTHDLEEAYSFGDQIAAFESGRILQFGDKEEVLRRPSTRKTARLLGTKNFFDGVVVKSDKQGLEMAVGAFILKTPPAHLSIGQKITALIRPSDLLLGTAIDNHYLTDGIKQAQGWIAELIPYPDKYTVFVKLFEQPENSRDYDLQIDVTRPVFERSHFVKDQAVTVGIPKDALFVLAA